MKSIFQVRRPLSDCEHICWTESGGNQIMGAVQWDIDNKCQRQSNEQRGIKDRRTSGGQNGNDIELPTNVVYGILTL